MMNRNWGRVLVGRLVAALWWTTDKRWRWLLACAALASIGLVPVVVLPTNSDVAWLLYATERVMSGARIYVDVVEVNPPLIVWLNLPPVALAELLGIRSRIPFLFYFMGLILLSLRISWRLFDHLGTGLPVRRRRAYLLLLVLALVALPGWVYGQREHFMVVLVTPYLLAVAARLTSGSPSRGTLWPAGFLGGIGFALKPYYLPAWLGVEVLHWLYVRHESRVGAGTGLASTMVDSLWRPELVTALVVVFTYGAAVFVATPEFFEMAERLAPIYVGVPQASLTTLVTQSVTLMSVFALGAFALSRVRPPASAVAKVFAVALLVWTLPAIVQVKGWWYHFYPALAAATVLLAIVIAEGEWQGRAGPVFLVPIVGILVLVGALGGRIGEAVTAATTGADFERRLPLTTQIVRQHVGEEGTLAVLSPHIHAAFPLANRAGVRWGLRFNSMWPLEAVYAEVIGDGKPVRYHAPEEMEAPERYFWESVLTDLTDDPPQVLLLDGKRIDGRGFDYLDYFGRDERFRSLLASCHPMGEFGRYRALRCGDPPAMGTLW